VLFQADDGIRDFHVTGVQTCALPIYFEYVLSDLKKGGGFSEGAEWIVKYLGDNASSFAGKKLKFEEVLKVGGNIRRVDVVDLSRSEERRVGKEGRCRWWACDADDKPR